MSFSFLVVLDWKEEEERECCSLSFLAGFTVGFVL